MHVNTDSSEGHRASKYTHKLLHLHSHRPLYTLMYTHTLLVPELSIGCRFTKKKLQNHCLLYVCTCYLVLRRELKITEFDNAYIKKFSIYVFSDAL